jgi:hypothetical protein
MFQFAIQGAASTQFQGEERQPLVLADLMDLDDVGMLQPGDGLPPRSSSMPPAG